MASLDNSKMVAIAYSEACNMLWEKKVLPSRETSFNFMPFMSMAALSCELSMKCLILANTGKPAVKKHDLETLFNDLNQKQQDLVRAWVCAQGSLNDQGFTNMLHQHANDFEFFRYAYEKMDNSFTRTPPFLYHLAFALIEQVREI